MSTQGIGTRDLSVRNVDVDVDDEEIEELLKNTGDEKASRCKTLLKWVKKNPKKTGLGITLFVLAIIGGALLTSMHFSHLAINKEGFIQLGHRISGLANKAWTSIVDAMKAPANLSIGKVIGIATGSPLGLFLIGLAGSKIKEAYDHRKANLVNISNGLDEETT